MRDFFKLFRRYIEGEQTEVSWNKIEPIPNEVVSMHINFEIHGNTLFFIHFAMIFVPYILLHFCVAENSICYFLV